MDNKPVFEKIINQKNQVLKVNVETITKTDVEANKMDKILALSPSVILIKKEDATDKAKYVGRIIYSIVYLSNEGEIKKVECGSEFYGSVNKKDNQKVKNVNFLVNKTTVDTYSGEVKVLANILVEVLCETQFYVGRECACV